jgi:hypothetical protein
MPGYTLRLAIASLVSAGTLGVALAAPASGCSQGVSLVACDSSTRVVVVGSSPDARYRTIQAALDAATAGDLILVHAGTYNEQVSMLRSGTPSAPITLKAYPGERPIIRPNWPARTGYVGLEGSWLVLDGFEITGGRHGVVVRGSHNVIRNGSIHGNGAGCPEEVCGQGILVASASDVVIAYNNISSNGLSTVSPWHAHGIYLSSHYGAAPSRISVIGNTISAHAGAGVHAWDATAVAATLLIQDNVLEGNTIDMVLSHVRDVLVRRNEVRHSTHPATDAPRSTLLWFESARNVALEANKLKYVPTAIGGVPSMPIHYYVTDQDPRELTWRGNRWESSNPIVSDALLNAPSVPGTRPGVPTLVAEQSSANPVILTWLAGAGASPADYTLVVGSVPGAADLGSFAMGTSTSLTTPAPSRTPLVARVVARNTAGNATSNEVSLYVSSPPPAAPTMAAPVVTGTTVRLSWQAVGTISGYTVLARYAPGGGVIASIPVAAGGSPLTLSAVPRGTYYVSVVAMNGALASPESNLVTVVVN